MSDDWYEEDDEEEGSWPAPWEDEEGPDGSDLARGAALGWLAMLPLLLAYEVGVLLMRGEWHNTSALALSSILRPFGEHADAARRILLGLLSLGALVYCLRREWALGPLLLRTAKEGFLAALVLGPISVLALDALGDVLPPLPRLAAQSGSSVHLAPALLLFGGAAYEELLFRLGLYGALYVVLRLLLSALSARGPGLRWSAEILSLLGSSLAFAAFHLEACVAWLGVGGDPFEPAIFTYRVLAGMLLGLLFRWRGPGVAAWAHGLFNLGLLLGAGPDVFR